MACSFRCLCAASIILSACGDDALVANPTDSTTASSGEASESGATASSSTGDEDDPVTPSESSESSGSDSESTASSSAADSESESSADSEDSGEADSSTVTSEGDASTGNDDESSDTQDDETDSEDSGSTTTAGDEECTDSDPRFADVCYVALPMSLPSVSFLGLEDLDEDGHLDLLLGQADAATVEIRLGDGKGNFAKHESFTAPPELGAIRTYLRGNFRGHGPSDLILEGHEKAPLYLLDTQTGEWTPIGEALHYEHSSWARIDLGGDTLDDFIVTRWQYSSDDRRGGYWVYAGRPTGDFELVAESNVSTSHLPGSVTVGDFDGDGFDDISMVGFNVEGGPFGTTTFFGRGDGTVGGPNVFDHPRNTGRQGRAGQFTRWSVNEGRDDLLVLYGAFGSELQTYGTDESRFFAMFGSPLSFGGDPGQYAAPQPVRPPGQNVDDVIFPQKYRRQFEYFRSDGEGEFTAVGDPLLMPSAYRNPHWAIGDMNGDGHVDFIVGSGLIEEAHVYLSTPEP